MTVSVGKGVSSPLLPVAPRAAVASLRAALTTETRIAEALAQRSRGLVDLVEALARRALAEAADLADATARLDALSRRMHAALAEGESARGADLAGLAERTLAPFESGAGPRIAVIGPAVALEAEAARLVALTLFELAALSVRRGALAAPDGRASLRWGWAATGLRLSWRECGGPPADGLRLGAGAGLLPLLEERFGAPLRVRPSPLGLHADLTLPRGDAEPCATTCARHPDPRP